VRPVHVARVAVAPCVPTGFGSDAVMAHGRVECEIATQREFTLVTSSEKGRVSAAKTIRSIRVVWRQHNPRSQTHAAAHGADSLWP
jgi:hypothetical protein